MKKIIFTKTKGAVVVIHPIRNTYPELESMTDEEVLKRATKDIPEGALNVRIVEESEIPIDRTFRNAWRDNAETITVDMPAAREIHRDQLRELRRPIFQELDVEFMRAIESGDKVKCSEIASRKQELRDVTDDPMIEAASTPEELKAAIPECLIQPMTATTV